MGALKPKPGEEVGKGGSPGSKLLGSGPIQISKSHLVANECAVATGGPHLGGKFE